MMLVSPDDEFAHRIGEAVGADPIRLRTAADAARLLDGANGDAPEVAVLGPGLGADAALLLAATIDREHPRTSVVLVTDAPVWEQALRAGVREVVAPGASPEELRAALARAQEVAARHRNRAEPAKNVAARVIAVVSPKGGCGKTTVATNLAVELAGFLPGQVALVDADLPFGDVTSALQLTPERSVADAARAGGKLDPMALKLLLTPHASGLYALCAPATPVEGEQIEGEALGHVLRLLTTQFGVVVADTSAGLSEHTLAVVEIATDLVLVASMDVSSVRGIRKVLDALDALGMTAARRHLVLNRADSRVGMEARDIEATLGLDVDVSLPSSRSVPLALNQGLAVVQADARAPVSRQLRVLAERFAPPQPVPLPTGRRWRKAGR